MWSGILECLLSNVGRLSVSFNGMLNASGILGDSKDYVNLVVLS